MGYFLQKEDEMRLAAPGEILFFVLVFLTTEQLFSQSVSQAPESPNFVSAQMSVQEFGRRLVPWELKHPELFTKVATGSQVITKSQLPHDQSVNKIYRMTFPTLDIYSSAGESFYFNDYSDENVKVIDALPRVIPKPDLDPRYKARPSLREALSMIPGTPRSDRATPAQLDYTIVAVVRNRTGDIKAQLKDASAGHAKNKAVQVQNMNGSGPDIRVRVTEVPDSPDLAQKNALAIQASALANQAQDEAIQRLKTRLNGSRIRVVEILLTE
jgi:hypothetical protein